jgi:dTDP-4-amino-4,6-dideoxygalactose transaminase
MTTAEGGMLVTNDTAIADKVRILRSHGMTTLTWDRHEGHASTYDVVALGYNYRIDEIRSAIGREQLRKIPAGNARRGVLVSLYRELLAERVPQISIPFEAQRGLSSYHILPVLLPEGSDKQGFMAHMKAQGIQTSWHYPPAHTFSIYGSGSAGEDGRLKLTDLAAKREVTLPLFPTMSEEQVHWVVEAARASLSA